MFEIQEVTDPEIVFGGRDMGKLMPAMKDIPDYPDKAKWESFVARVFFEGATGANLLPREGVDKAKALRHFRAIMVSFQPRHEHKEAACAYLLSQWFSGWGEGEA